ncbi:18405_t:CDS:1, partial [Racocetra persica]
IAYLKVVIQESNLLSTTSRNVNNGVSKGDDSEKEYDFLFIIEMIEDYISEVDNFNSEPKNSLLKEIYTDSLSVIEMIEDDMSE